jgi:hypothetical protein
MCGLVGAAGHLQIRDDTVIKRLLMLDFFRGVDSTGLAGIRTNGEVNIAKIANTPPVLFDVGKFKNLLSGVNRVFIGHNRAATKGKTCDYNAHPFQFGDIVGAHNGTLDPMSHNRLNEAIGEKFEVDSQALFAAIDKVGIKEAIELCTTGSDGMQGAWSLVWYDLKDGSINFLRNKHRPLWYAWDDAYRRIYWASEWWMLEAAGRADGIEFATEGEKGYRFFPTDEDRHYRFDVGLMVTATERQKPKVKEISGREPVTAVNHGAFPTRGMETNGNLHTNVCGFVATASTKRQHSGRTSTTTSHGQTTRPSLSSDRVIHWMGTEQYPYAGYIDEIKFSEIAKYGCTWCQKTLEYGDPGITILEQQCMALCSTCSGHDAVEEITPTRIYVSPTEFINLKG